MGEGSSAKVSSSASVCNVCERLKSCFCLAVANISSHIIKASELFPSRATAARKQHALQCIQLCWWWRWLQIDAVRNSPSLWRWWLWWQLHDDGLRMSECRLWAPFSPNVVFGELMATVISCTQHRMYKPTAALCEQYKLHKCKLCLSELFANAFRRVCYVRHQTTHILT